MEKYKLSKMINTVLVSLCAVALLSAGFWVHGFLERERVLRQVVERLSADSLVAEVLVTKSEYDEVSKKVLTTIKFLEYGPDAKPLEPRYFSFRGNLIQFQALVVRFQDALIKSGNRLKGKSAFIFLKAFVLDGKETQVFDITSHDEIPRGYKIQGVASDFELDLWKEFWSYALNPAKRESTGIKNAQIEAPGALFLPGSIYTLRIEHDGGLRIDARAVPEILKGEKL